jgi:hypothetical protein
MRCELRDTEEAATCPSTARSQVSSARAYSKALREGNDGFGIYGDVYVTSYTFGSRPGGRKAGNSPKYPTSGFVISKKFERFGGTKSLHDMCTHCPANARPEELARCAGTVPQWPDSPDTEDQLTRIIDRLGLESAVASAFPRTTPIWYGLWAVTPVPHASLGVLHTLLGEMLEQDRTAMESKGVVDNDQIDEFSAVLSAIDIAASRRLNLHVKLLPLGHTDFGIYTVFPHCPFCKATARVARWQRKYPLEHHVCHVCGTKFSPQETASSERMDWDLEELRDTLGHEQFEEFAKNYLIANGESRDDAAAIVRATEADDLKRREAIRRNQELDRLRQRYLERHIYVGLEYLPSPPSDLDDDTPECKEESGCTGWFSAENLTIVLQRCKERGIEITMMQHWSSSGDWDRYEMHNLKSPLDILSTWLADGCIESFSAACRVPDSLAKMEK